MITIPQEQICCGVGGFYNTLFLWKLPHFKLKRKVAE